MDVTPIYKTFKILLISFSLVLSCSLSQAETSEKGVPSCGLLDSFAGDVLILNSSRTQILNVTSRLALPCGTWVSVNQGWAQIKHQNGPRIYLGNQTFVQLNDFRKDSEFKGDHTILYKGQIYVQANEGEEEFRIVTAGARARIKRGKLVAMFDPAQDETQIITLSNVATLENRFEPSRIVQAKAGESTQLNFKLLRVIPSAPQAVAAAPLKSKLFEMHVPQSDQTDAVRAVLNRQNRKFAATLDTSRSPASDGQTDSYLRHAPEPVDAYLKNHLMRKMVGGEQMGERILYPDRYYGNSQKIRVQVEDPGTPFDQKLLKQEEVEKKRLMDELLKIRVE
jgi:hypothetical protein